MGYNKMPEEVKEIAREAVDRFPNNAQKSTEWALTQLGTVSEEFKGMDFSNERLISRLIGYAMYEIILEVRHSETRQLKRSGPFDKEVHMAGDNQKGRIRQLQKVTALGVRAVQEGYIKAFNWYDMKIGGKRLGNIKGEEIPEVIVSCELRAGGEIFNANLLKSLQPHVPAGASVEESISNEKIGKRANRLKKLLSASEKQVAGC